MAALLCFAGCAPAKETQKQAGEHRTGRFTGGTSGYCIVALTQNSIVAVDTKQLTETTLLKCSIDTATLSYSASPAYNKVAIGFYDPALKNSYVYLYFVNEQKLLLVKTVKGARHINLLWTDDSLLYINSFEKKLKGKTVELSNPFTELFNVYSGETVRSFKPKEGAVLLAYIKQKYLVYADSKDIALVDVKSLKLYKAIKDLGLSGKTSFAFSPEGDKLITVQPVKGKNGTANQLIVSRYDGTDDKIVLGAQYDPKNVQWLPVTSNIICNIRSQEFPNVRHTAVIDISTYKTSFRSEEVNGSAPSIVNIAVSPTGNFILLKKTADNMADPTYVIRDVRNDRDNTLRDSIGVFTSTDLGEFESWRTEGILSFKKTGFGSVIYNLMDRSFTLLSFTHLLYIRESE